MKKLFVILPCLLLCLIMVAVPVSAASSDVIFVATVDDGMCSVPSDQLAQGLYTLKFEPVDSDNLIFTISPVEVTNVAFEQDFYDVPDFIYSDQQVRLRFEYDDDFIFDFVDLSGDPVGIDGSLTFYTYSPPPSPIGIFEVFGVLGAWIPVALGSLVGIFWTGSSLTFLGVLAVCALAFAVVFLIIAIIQRFLHFRG